MTPAWQPGARAGDYQLEERLGGGGMGDVFRARHLSTGALRAIKALPRGVSQDALLRFQREAQAQATVDAHPNVVRIHTTGQEAGRHYLVMDLAPGGDLATRLRKGPLEPDAAAFLVEQLARGLAHTHANGVLHRDLKPANVVFSEDDTPRLVDFGVARIAGADALTRTGTLVGTPAYMAPEQARGEAMDERTDVYGLGAVLYAALTGRAPFSSRGLQLLHDVATSEPTPPSGLQPGVPDAIEQVCLRALSKSPGERPPTATALADALVQARAGLGSAPSHGPLILAGLGLLGALALLAFVLPWPESAPLAPAPAPIGSRTTPLEPAPRTVENPPWVAPEFEGELPPVQTPETALELDEDIYRGLDRFGRGARERLAQIPGDGEAMLGIGVALRHRHGQAGNQIPTLHWYLRAREAGHHSGSYEAAIILRHHPAFQDLARAALLFAENAHGGDPRGMGELAEMLYWGQGMVCDPETARRWLERAVARQSVSGRPYVLLGELLHRGHGGIRDADRARRLFEAALDRPYDGSGALLWLARLRPRKERITFLRAEIAARAHTENPLRHPLVLVELGDLLRDADDLPGAEASYTTARGGEPPWLRHVGMLRLAEARRLGWGGDRSWGGGKGWLEQAANYGSTEAMLKMADDPQTDPALARSYVERAASLGDPIAMERLAGLLGPGAEADGWLERARRRRLVVNER